MKIESHDPKPGIRDPQPELVDGQSAGLTITVRNPYTGELTTDPADCDRNPDEGNKPERESPSEVRHLTSDL